MQFIQCQGESFLEHLAPICDIIQLVPINSTLSFVVCTTKAIKSGQEVFVNYGENYLEDLGQCPCKDCKGEGYEDVHSEDAPLPLATKSELIKAAFKKRRAAKKLKATIARFSI